MMAKSFYGCDVMPSAIHITGSTLAGAYPNVGFDGSRLYTLAYGRQPDESVKIGSLELLRTSSIVPLFNTSEPARRTDRIGEETAAYIIADVPDQSFDMVIMNPPFTRATNHEGAHADVTNPAFAAFGATPEDQTAMGKLMNEMAKGTCYHGNAGIATAFAAVGHKKLKQDGVLALVLPLSAASGLSWQGLRKMLATDYTVLSIAANGKEMSFSSDTGMGECLVVARKRKADDPSTQRAHFVSLRRRPQGFAQADAMAKNIVAHDHLRRIQDGPYGGTDLAVGDEVVGEMVTAPLPEDGGNWGGVRLLDCSLAQTAYALTESKLWLPGQPAEVDLELAPLGVVGRLGLVDRDINGPAPRGPFTKTAPSHTSTYPALWNHSAKKETRMVCEPDSQLQVRLGMEEKAAEVWTTATHVHLNREYTFGSQALAVAFTGRKSIGGTAWPNVSFSKKQSDYAFAVWGNSTLGLLAYWWHSSRQQSSKARMTIRSAESMPVLDFRALSDASACDGRGDIRRLPRQGAEACVPCGRRPQPRPAGPARRLRPTRLRRGHIRGGAAPLGEVVRRAVGARGEEAAQGREVRGVMDRQELIAHIEDLIAHISANVPAAQGGSAAVGSLRAIVAGLEGHDEKGAVGAAERLVRDIEEMGGIAWGMNMGPRDEREVIVYGSEAARDNHQYALRLLALVREVAVRPSAVNGAAGAPESQATPGVVTADQWLRAFDHSGTSGGSRGLGPGSTGAPSSLSTRPGRFQEYRDASRPRPGGEGGLQTRPYAGGFAGCPVWRRESPPWAPGFPPPPARGHAFTGMTMALRRPHKGMKMAPPVGMVEADPAPGPSLGPRDDRAGWAGCYFMVMTVGLAKAT